MNLFKISVVKISVAITFFMSLLLAAFGLKAEVVDQSARQKEVWHLVMAHIIANQPQTIGFDQFAKAVGVKRGSAEGQQFIRDGLMIKEWPRIFRDGGALQIGSKHEGRGPTLRIELVDAEKGDFKINAQPFHLDRQKPVLKQFRDYLRVLPGAQSTKAASMVVPLLIQDAYADDSMSLGAVGWGGNLVGVTAVTLAAMALPFEAAVATVAVGGGLVVGNAVCAIGETYESNPSWSGYINCMSTPLTWLGMNPRDNYYLDDLQCEEGKAVTTVRSASGKSQTRTFTYLSSEPSKDRLRKIEIKGNSALDRGVVELTVAENGARIENGQLDVLSSRPKVLVRPKHTKELNEAQGLLRDFTYYKGLCDDPKRREIALKEIKAGRLEAKAFEGPAIKDLRNKATQ